jgi:hypothetical protein
MSTGQLIDLAVKLKVHALDRLGKAESFFSLNPHAPQSKGRVLA